MMLFSCIRRIQCRLLYSISSASRIVGRMTGKSLVSILVAIVVIVFVTSLLPFRQSGFYYSLMYFRKHAVKQRPNL